MLLGNLKRVQGKIQISGKISFFPEKLFFLKDTVKENIRFFNRNISNMEIEEIYNEFGLNIDLRFENELNTMIDDESKFTKSVLKRICLARCLSSDADIYILDNPFEDLSDEYQQVVERRLRFLQDKSKTIILSSRHLFASSKNDLILIL
jgi:ABC-type multidrug transport system fused ATPase/permease subunit